ncbi:putative cupredoxin, phytocyanin [Helianthus annuus]|nr:putative cupredoxin, phytocyanin [Helianthus annuus]
MATSRLSIVFMLTFFVLATSIYAKEYIVGDENGWKLDFDYQTWAKDKVFYVGDTRGMLSIPVILFRFSTTKLGICNHQFGHKPVTQKTSQHLSHQSVTWMWSLLW